MNCPYCKYDDVPDDAPFCPDCGKEMPATPPTLIASKIIDYHKLVAKSTERFVGREWLRQYLIGFLETEDKRYFLLSGEPGLGKTAFLAHLVAREGYVHHFVSAGNLDWLSPVAFVHSVGAQLAQRFGAWVLAEEEAPPGIDVDMDIGAIATGGTAIGVLIEQYVGLPVEELARKLIVRPLKRLAAREKKPVVLTIDAVDEATSYSGQTTIYDLLTGLGATANARIVLTAHPGPALEDLTFDLESAGLIHVQIDGEHLDNLRDARAYLEQAVAGLIVAQALTAAGVSPAEFIEETVTRSEGNFLYLTSLLDAIRSGQTGFDLKALPAGLTGYYRDQVRLIRNQAGQEWRRRYRPVLGGLAVARAPLTARQLADLSHVDRDVVDEVLECVRLLLDERETADGLPAYRWYHRAFADFLLSERDNPRNWFDPQRYHTQVAGRIQARYPDPSHIDDEYALHNLAYHTRHAGPPYFQRLYELITPDVRRARRARFGTDYVFSQYLAEAIGAALEEGPEKGLPQLVRCGLIDATLSSMVTEVPPDLLRDLAWLGQWTRALNMAHLSAGRKGPGLEAVVEGLLMAGAPGDLELAQQIAAQIPQRDDDAVNRARSLARVAAYLFEVGEEETAGSLFSAARASAEEASVLDDRGRALAFVAQLQAPFRSDESRRTFDAALAAVRSMPVELDTPMREEISAATMVSQQAIESSGLIGQIPFDTVGSKARALADVAAEMARAGDPRADAIFGEAENIVAQIAAGGIHDSFASHATEYIASRRNPSRKAPAPEPDARAIEVRLKAAERLPTDKQGSYSLALLQLARALLDGRDAAHARDVLGRAAAAAQAAAGGYQAKLLADAAALWQDAGDTERATVLAKRAAEIAGDDVDLLAGYRALLAEKGGEWAANLRTIAMSRALIRKQRYYSDKALSEMAQSLAAGDLEGALILLGEIQDGSQRVRALAAIAGHSAGQDSDAAKGYVEEILDTAQAASEDMRDYLLAGAVEILAPLHPLSAEYLSTSIATTSFKSTALVSAAVGREAQGMEAGEAWDHAWQIVQAAQQKTATLALAIAQISRHWHETGDHRAVRGFDLALEMVWSESDRVERIDAAVRIAAMLSPFDPDQAYAALKKAKKQADTFAEVRAQGQALSRIAGVMMDIDPGSACRLLANLRRLGRDSFLDGVACIIRGAARLGGTALAWQIYQALEEVEEFFRT